MIMGESGEIWPDKCDQFCGSQFCKTPKVVEDPVHVYTVTVQGAFGWMYLERM